MIHIKPAVIVEGKYDKIKLSGLLDTLIIETDGFRIFKNKARLQMIRRIAKERGIVILTDSDAAGFRIRSYLRGSVPEGNIYEAYIPDIFGKERRKAKPSAEGKLGVEGVPTEVLLEALRHAGVPLEEEEKLLNRSRPITKTDLYTDGLSGGEGSRELRKAFLRSLGLPDHLSSNSLVQVLNVLYSYEEYQNKLALLRKSDAKCRIVKHVVQGEKKEKQQVSL